MAKAAKDPALEGLMILFIAKPACMFFPLSGSFHAIPPQRCQARESRVSDGIGYMFCSPPMWSDRGSIYEQGTCPSKESPSDVVSFSALNIAKISVLEQFGTKGSGSFFYPSMWFLREI